MILNKTGKKFAFVCVTRGLFAVLPGGRSGMAKRERNQYKIAKIDGTKIVFTSAFTKFTLELNDLADMALACNGKLAPIPVQSEVPF